MRQLQYQIKRQNRFQNTRTLYVICHESFDAIIRKKSLFDVCECLRHLELNSERPNLHSKLNVGQKFKHNVGIGADKSERMSMLILLSDRW